MKSLAQQGGIHKSFNLKGRLAQFFMNRIYHNTFPSMLLFKIKYVPSENLRVDNKGGLRRRRRRREAGVRRREKDRGEGGIRSKRES